MASIFKGLNQLCPTINLIEISRPNNLCGNFLFFKFIPTHMYTNDHFIFPLFLRNRISLAPLANPPTLLFKRDGRPPPPYVDSAKLRVTVLALGATYEYLRGGSVTVVTPPRALAVSSKCS